MVVDLDGISSVSPLLLPINICNICIYCTLCKCNKFYFLFMSRYHMLCTQEPPIWFYCYFVLLKPLFYYNVTSPNCWPLSSFPQVNIHSKRNDTGPLGPFVFLKKTDLIAVPLKRLGTSTALSGPIGPLVFMIEKTW